MNSENISYSQSELADHKLIKFTELVGLDEPAQRLIALPLTLTLPTIKRGPADRPSAVLLYGPTGCGKKSLVHALAAHRQLLLVQVACDDVIESLRRAGHVLRELDRPRSAILLLSHVDRTETGSVNDIRRLLNAAVRDASGDGGSSEFRASDDSFERVVDRLAVVIATTAVPSFVDLSLMTSDPFTEHVSYHVILLC